MNAFPFRQTMALGAVTRRSVPGQATERLGALFVLLSLLLAIFA